VTVRDGHEPARSSGEELLAGLTDAQRHAVTTDAAPVCIIAAAGSGKTRVLTRRVAFRVLRGEADPRHVLVLTFTRKAAGELRERLHQLGLRDEVTAGTFHAIAAAQLRRWWRDRGQRPPALLERKARLLGPLVADRPALRGVAVAELAGHLEWAKAQLIGPEDFADAARVSRRALPAPAADVAALYRRYEDEKRRRGLVDFDDLLVRCADAMHESATFAGAQRWQWRHLFVDEFQDVNPLQHRLLSAWLGPSTDLCIVGDPHQAIYRWNGADPELLARVPVRWPSTEVIRLDANHRCSPQIVAAASAVLGPSGGELRSTQGEGPPPSVRSFSSDVSEAHGVATQLRQAHAEGTAWSQMAVLARTNAQFTVFREALTAAGIPFRAPNVDRMLDHPAARSVLAALRAAPDRLLAVAHDLVTAASVPTSSGEAGTADDREVVLTAMLELLREYAKLDPGGRVAGFLGWLPAAWRDDGPTAGTHGHPEAVTLCSFHRAKGLEWAAVWVTGMEQGLVPIGRATSSAAEAEERRLLYVALTRAARDLHCSWAERRAFGANSVPRQPSPWLSLVQASVGEQGSLATDSSDWRDRVRRELRDQRAEFARSRRAVSRPGHPAVLPAGWSEPDPQLVRAIQRWRAQAARASGVPAHVLLHDVTIGALAALRPTTLDELLAVPGLGPVKARRHGAALLSLMSSGVASA
jgi:DNA helicase-2/ATP-dependent DNA helicase PcrA